MTNEEKDIEYIERYLDGNLSAAEVRDFENRLSVDDRFSSLFDQFTDLCAGIRYSARKKMFRDLKKLEADIALETKFERKILNIPPRRFYSLSIAATTSLLICIALVFFLRHQSSPYEVYEEYFRVYPNIEFAMARGEKSVKSPIEKGYYHYNVHDYRGAIEAFNEILAEEEDASALFYLGNSYLAVGKPKKAIQTFKKLTDMSSPYKNQAFWYLGLSYLAENEVNSARKIFKNIKTQGTSYSDKADAILEKLKQ